MTLLFALPLERGLPLSHYVRRLLPVILPLLVGGLGLLAYNYLRFGQPLEFGQHYQLWGDGTSASKFFGAAHFPFNFWLYFFSLPEFSPYFPFFHPVWIGRLPANYNNVEDLHGLLFALPVQLLGFAAWLIFEKRRREPLLRPLGLVLLAATAASVLAGSIIFFQTGSCSRYITELVAGWSVVTGIGLLAVFSRPTNHLARTFAAAGGGRRRPLVAGLRLARLDRIPRSHAHFPPGFLSRAGARLELSELLGHPTIRSHLRPLGARSSPGRQRSGPFSRAAGHRSAGDDEPACP